MQSFYNKALSNESEQVILNQGKNIIPPPKEASLWKQYIQKFSDPIIIVLLVVFALSVGVSFYEYISHTKDWTTFIEPLGVLIALILSTGIAFICEIKANKEFKVVNQAKNQRPVKVLRKENNGRTHLTLVERCNVVCEDIIKLEPGDEVPADGVILFSQNLMIDESAFTGEPYVHKSEYPQQNDQSTYSNNFVLRSSIVIDGYAFYRVTAIGLDTEEGKGISIEREEKKVKTPLNIQLEDLGHKISVVSFIIAGLILVGRLLYYFVFASAAGDSILQLLEYILESIMLAVTLIVVAVPEGLPMSITMSLALSMRKMLRSKNLIRKLHACETMGATTVICTDKTGTLTQNKMRVVQTFFGDNNLPEYIAQNISINSTAELDFQNDGVPFIVGNPTEGALLIWLREQGINYVDIRESATLVRQIPFSTESKSMSTTIKTSEGNMELIKGAPEILLKQCECFTSGLTKDSTNEFLTFCQQHAMRTLGFAMRQNAQPMTFIGAVGIADPIREDVPEAISICKNNAGVRVIIVTGDNALTAKEIGKQIGLITNNDDVSIDGQDFAMMSDEQILMILPHLKILSRAKPEDKARLVTLLQQSGEIVAVTGDGTNDALALSKAQVGLSMGDGTVRAKEASDITILDNSFSSINMAITWGRSLYLNIKRFILFQMTINVCACMVVLAGAFMGLDSPLTVTQMLWVNLIMDTFAALALSSLPADSKVMNAPPRKATEHIIDKKMAKLIFGVGFLFFIYLWGLWQLLWHSNVSSVRDLLTYESITNYITGFGQIAHIKPHLSQFELGIFFTTFVVIQFWNLFNVKYFHTDRSFFLDIIDLFRSPQKVKQTYSWGFILIAIAIILGQVVIVECFGPLFNIFRLSFADWKWILVCTSIVLFIPEVYRNARILIRKYNKNSSLT